jgi:hypothetical protein
LDSSKLNLLQNQDYSSNQVEQWNSWRGKIPKERDNSSNYY